MFCRFLQSALSKKLSLKISEKLSDVLTEKINLFIEVQLFICVISKIWKKVLSLNWLII